MARHRRGRHSDPGPDSGGDDGKKPGLELGSGHGHGHGEPVDTSAVDEDALVARRVRLGIACVLVPLILATAVMVFKLWPDGEVKVDDAALTDQARGEVVALKPCAKPDQCDDATVRITDAKTASGDVGKEFPVKISKGRLATEIHTGDRILMGVNQKEARDGRYQFVDLDRGRPLLLLSIIFALAVLALSRWRGLTALGALAVSVVTLTEFVLPAIIHGSDPLWVAVVGGAAIMIVALYLTHGLSAQTSVALVGTIGALGLTAVLGKVFIEVARFTGLTSEQAGAITAWAPNIDLRGLLLAGLVIGALGVLDDVTVTQATAVWELAALNRTATRRQLFGAGLRIGRAHVASVVNTLVLAYAGAALPLLTIFAISAVPAGYAITTENVAVELVRALVGSLGIIAAVPLTTALAALAVGGRATSSQP
jgi:uncharacterized membrane protein